MTEYVWQLKLSQSWLGRDSNLGPLIVIITTKFAIP